MFPNLRNVIKVFFKPFFKNKKLNTYVVFFFISFAFWFFHMLSRIHETTFSIPITYVNYPVDLKGVVEPSDVVYVRVKASGVNIISFHLFNHKSLSLNYDVSNSQPINNGKNLFWIMNSKRKELAHILGSSIEIMNVTPERVVVPFVSKIKKEVPVILDSEINLQQQFWLANDIRLNPSSVILYGEQDLLDSINSVNTDFLQLDDLDKDQLYEMPLVLPNGLGCNVDFVLVELNVEPFIEEVVTEEVEVRNLPNRYQIKLFPKNVDVALRLPKDKYQLLKTDFLKLYIDASTIRDKRTIPVKYDNLPATVKVERIYPNHLEFLLIKE